MHFYKKTSIGKSNNYIKLVIKLILVFLVFIALLFYTLEAILIFGIAYLISIPISIILFINQNKKNLKISDENHEDVL